jgi:cysteine desulfurase
MKPKKPIYLDYAAATPLDPRVAQAMAPYLDAQFANPGALYAAGRAARAALEDARHRIAMVLGAKTGEIVLTAGATESINLAIFGVARQFPASAVIATSTEHESILGCMRQLEAEGHPIVLAPVLGDGLLDLPELAAAITDQTALITVAYANSETGVIQSMRQVSKLVQAVRQDRQKRGVQLPLYLHTDAAQAAGLLDIHVSRLGVDLMTLSAAKIYGPKQVGALYVRTGVRLLPIIWGGGQERALRSGTQNVAGAVGFATALELAQLDREQQAVRLLQLRDNFWSQLLEISPTAELNGHLTKRLTSHLNFSIPGLSGEDLVYQLDAAGIAVATGSACSAGSGEPSHVLLAMGRTPEVANSSLRITLGRATAQQELDVTIAKLAQFIPKA